MNQSSKIFFIICYFSIITIEGRSIHRPEDPLDPLIMVHYEKDNIAHSLRNSHLQEIIFKIFDQHFFNQHLLPQSNIFYRYNSSQQISGKKLSLLIEHLLEEIKANKKKFSNFIILKCKDFAHDHTGLIILKFKDYPFVLKLFIETPTSFVRPLDKGFESSCFFYMGGGVSRYINGFTRIKNLEYVRNIILSDPYWCSRVDFPRKWFWLPKTPKWLLISGYNIGPQKVIHTRVPSIYAIICDEIIWQHEFSMMNSKERQLAMQLSNFLELRLDPHINNFGIEQQSGKIVPIDFEHFPSVVGLKKSYTYNSYTEWFTHLSYKMAYDTFGRSKKTRRDAQYAVYQNNI